MPTSIDRAAVSGLRHLHARTPAERRARHVVSLDREQQHVLDLPRDASVLIRGEAGYGKTTVALRRLKALTAGTGRHDEARGIVLVPTEGLRESIRAAMNGLGLFDTEVRTVDEWIDAQARRAFPDVPTRESRDATMSVIRLKRHPAVGHVLQDALGALGRDRRARYWDLFHVWTDERLMERVVSLSEGELTTAMAKRVIAHACVQFSRIDEDDPARFDAILTYDFKDIDEGTPDQDAGAVDAEDLPVLFEIDRLKGGTARDRIDTFDHVLLDEAQEVAPMELALIGAAVAPGGSLTVVGDERQQTDPTAYFRSWDELVAGLGVADVSAIALSHSYRCPSGVTRFAGQVLDADEPPTTPDRSVVVTAFDDDRLAAVLAQELSALSQIDADARIAVVLRRPPDAEQWRARIRRKAKRNLRLRPRPESGAHICVTSLDQVRGLEFDYVVLPDIDAERYPDTPASRRALYLASTRALHQLWVSCGSAPSPLIRAATRSLG